MGLSEKKIYYTMGEVSEMLDVNPSLLRFWEGKFDIIKPHKNKKGNRLFTPKDVENLKLIYHLVKEKGMTLAGAHKTLKGERGTISRDAELLERLMTVRSLLVEIRQELKEEEGEIYSDSSTDTYEPCMAVKPIAEPAPEPEPLYEEDDREESPDYPVDEPPFDVEPAEEQVQPAPEESKPLPRIVEQTLF